MKSHLAASALALMGTTASAQELEATLPEAVAAVAPALQDYAETGLFGQVWTADSLSQRDRALVTFAAPCSRTKNWQVRLALTLPISEL